MPTIFYSKDSVFFAGGQGTKAGDANAGGCTQSFWDSSQTLSDVMGANGEPLSAAATWGGGSTYPCTTSQHTGNKVKITYANGFNNCAAGLIAYVEFESDYPSGFYEVIEKIDNSNIVIDLAWEVAFGDPDCRCNAGGAFPSIVSLSGLDPSHGYNTHLYTNIFEELLAGWAGPPSGLVANNSYMIVEGFHTQPGDMNYGETYYQSPLDCLKNGVDTVTPKCVTLNAQGGSCDVVTITAKNSIIFKNVYFYNTDKANSNCCIEFVSNPRNISFVNCKFDKAYSGLKGTVYGCTIRDCYFGKDFDGGYCVYVLSAHMGDFVNCVLNGENLNGCVYMTARSFFDGCLFWKSSYGARFTRTNHFRNCVFYGQTNRCLYPSDATYAAAAGYNNIFIPAAVDDRVALSTTPVGSVFSELMQKSCIWTLAGKMTAKHISINGIEQQLLDVIEEDPLFVDAANGDFRPRNPAVLRGGKPDISGNPTQMGAILQKYQFGDRERIANMARLRIIR